MQNFDWGNFDEYKLFTYLTEKKLMDVHCLLSYTCKRCIVFKQFDRLNFDGLARRRQKCQNSPIKILHYTVGIKLHVATAAIDCWLTADIFLLHNLNLCVACSSYS